jgi:hypothetical protein
MPSYEAVAAALDAEQARVASDRRVLARHREMAPVFPGECDWCRRSDGTPQTWPCFEFRDLAARYGVDLEESTAKGRLRDDTGTATFLFAWLAGALLWLAVLAGGAELVCAVNTTPGDRPIYCEAEVQR